VECNDLGVFPQEASREIDLSGDLPTHEAALAHRGMLLGPEPPTFWPVGLRYSDLAGHLQSSCAWVRRQRTRVFDRRWRKPDTPARAHARRLVRVTTADPTCRAGLRAGEPTLLTPCEREPARPRTPQPRGGRAGGTLPWLGCYRVTRRKAPVLSRGHRICWFRTRRARSTVQVCLLRAGSRNSQGKRDRRADRGGTHRRLPSTWS
jgi:hypothetical protein